jgi:hypothetical protein
MAATFRRWSRNSEVRWLRLAALLEENAAALKKQGSIASRQAGKRRVFLLRFVVGQGDQKVQRAIYIGDDPRLVRRVRIRLALLRDRADWNLDSPGLKWYCALLSAALLNGRPDCM